jgi:flagellar assembly factor FliW
MTIKIFNPAIGEIELDESTILTFQEGMLGLPEYKKYVLIDSPQIKPFLRLQCVEEPQISFLAIDPANIDPGYREYMISRDPNHYFIDNPDDVVLLVVCKVSEDGSDITGNLQAPVIINHRKMAGCQVVLLDGPYHVRHSLVQAVKRKEAS